ncbi:hypothetical protein JHK84_048117 [Glycine max]|uniref:G-type lectin S-receptor-like serine/threonine-protein kinase n=1 Tax=Glycine soja TaxID=3848 RepID=A0A0B2RWM7_GLYSO|nr:hypothetical protein JHK86_048083 [Glycine max]KAG4944060.1 hypothetical protein JHK85_048706 [Glycine max]KAG5103148.1 hypothetical protein JHK84_048117 [Glycine max]KHN38791.1 G-type lectin S-receptor-like serine/threonine-protein kinase [Glycine soja]
MSQEAYSRILQGFKGSPKTHLLMSYTSNVLQLLDSLYMEKDMDDVVTKIAIIVLGHSADTLGSNVGPLIQQKVEKLLTQTNSVHKELRTQSKQFMALQEETLAFERLHDIAVGTAKGIAYLHEECQQRIIHYDIKLGNILLDGKLNPKVTDFGRRRNLGVQLVESQEWFPIWIWKRFDAGEFQKLIIACGIKEKNREITERMVDVALSFVQYRPDSRPIMSDVVKMLEGSVEILKPLNPFQPFMDGNFTSHPVQVPLTYTTDTNGFSDVVTDSSIVHVTLIL